MPAISSQADVVVLQSREWRNTIGQSGMTPTAFAFLIPVFVVAIAAPFLCAYCVRKRRQVIPVTSALKATKPPALRRTEAREWLNEVTEASNMIAEPEAERLDAVENNATVDSGSLLGRECAICLSTLHAPAPPEPAKLNGVATAEEAAKSPSIEDTAAGESEVILRLQVCQHEFHAECLVSWFVLRKTSCPICRAVYYSQEAMQAHDDEESAQLAAAAAAAASPPTPATLEAQSSVRTARNWWFFLHGNRADRNQERNTHVEMQPTQQTTQSPTPEAVSQTPRSRWQRLHGRS